MEKQEHNEERMDDEQLAKDIFKYRHAKRYTFEDMLIGSGVVMTEETARRKAIKENHEEEKRKRYLATKEKFKYVPIKGQKEKNKRAAHNRLLEIILRFVDWLNKIAGVKSETETPITEMATHEMASLSQLFYEYEDERENEQWKP